MSRSQPTIQPLFPVLGQKETDSALNSQTSFRLPLSIRWTRGPGMRVCPHDTLAAVPPLHSMERGQGVGLCVHRSLAAVPPLHPMERGLGGEVVRLRSL